MPRWGTPRRRRRATPRRMVRSGRGAHAQAVLYLVRQLGVRIDPDSPVAAVSRTRIVIAYLWKRSGETSFYTTMIFHCCTVRRRRHRRRRYRRRRTVRLSSLSTRFVRLPPPSLLHGHLTSSQPRRRAPLAGRPEFPTLRRHLSDLT